MIKDMSFSSIPGRAVAFSLLFVAIIVASCVNDDYAGQQSGSSSGREVTVTVNIPRQQSPSTRSIDDQGGEAVVDNISLLVFEPATGGEKLSEVVNGTILSQSSSSASNYEVKFKAVLKANATATTLAVIANAKDIVTALTPGMTKAASYQQLIYASTNAGGTPEDWKWKANKEAASSSSARPYIDYTPIPMHGEYTLPSGGVKEGMNISSIPLIRMLARIDIQNSFPGFTLDKVYLANYNTQGLVASDGNAGGGNPILNIPSGTNPQKGEANAQCYTYPASGGGLVGEIYTYEAAATTGEEGTAGHTDAVCLIIEGELSAKTYYYRIDFTATMDAAGKKPGETGFDPSTVAYIPLYRNHHYVLDIERVGFGYNSFDDALRSLGLRNNMKTTLLVVDESQIKDITFDDKHFFGIGEEEVILAASSGDEVEIPCITNHPNGWGLRTDNAYPIGIEYTNGYSGWLKAIKDGNPTDKKANLKLTAISDNNSGYKRVAYVHLLAGTLVHRIEVTQHNLLLRIIDDNNGEELTELLFCEAENATIASQHFTVKWVPNTGTVNILNSSQAAYPFPSLTGGSVSVPVIGSSLTNSAGEQTYTITPPAITAQELKADPFMEKASLLNFSISSGANSENKSILLRQMVPNLVVDQSTTFYRTDGSRYSFKVRSNSSWEISSVVPSVGTLLNLQPNDNLKLNTSGGFQTVEGSGTEIFFTTANNTGASGTVTVTFRCTDTKLHFADKSVVLSLSGEYYPDLHHGWAGSNIYWDGTKLTFDDVDITTHQYYQGVFFQWGSLWGIAPNGTNGSGWNNIVYKLDGSGAHIKSTSAIGWNNTNIPRVDDTSKTSNPPAGKSARDRNYLYEITDGVSGKGDICKYLTEHAPGKLIHGKKWRMPTSSEFGVNANYSWSGSWSAVTSNNDAGVYNLSVRGRVTKAADTPNGHTATIFPASGSRDGNYGQLNGVGGNGVYWSGSPNGTSGYSLYFYHGYVNPANNYSRSYGFSVRCVAE